MVRPPRGVAPPGVPGGVPRRAFDQSERTPPTRVEADQSFRYPKSDLEVINYAMGSQDSTLLVHSTIRNLVKLKDRLALVVVDYAVNDAHQSQEKTVIAAEAIVDTVQRHKARPALVFLETFRVGADPGDSKKHCDAGLGYGVIGKQLCSKMYHVQDAHALVAAPARAEVH